MIKFLITAAFVLVFVFILFLLLSRMAWIAGKVLRSLFPDKFRDIVTQCFLDNNDSFAKLFNDPEFYQRVQDAMAQELYKALRKD